MVATFGDGPRARENDRTPERIEGVSDDFFVEAPRLGHDLRIILACVGGGAIRIGAEVARHHLRYLETVAINCDPRVQDREEFDRRVCLGPDRGDPADAGGSPAYGAQLARSALPALERIFEGSTFVTVIGSLGGGTGTGALPYVLDAAARSSQVLSVFAIKPFVVEGERRAVAERALGRLHFIESFVEKQERGAAQVQVLDNETLARGGGARRLGDVTAHWADLVATHIERAFIAPAESILEAHRAQSIASAFSVRASEPVLAPPPAPAPPFAPLLPHASWELPGAPPTPADAELTFEVDRTTDLRRG